MFEGSFVALITPFKNGKEVDYEALERLIKFQLDNGTKGVVPCGTTGESATLTEEERKKIIEKTLEFINRKALVIPGTGTNSTATTIKLTKMAKDAGADGVLLVCPYYNKPTQEGIYQHYKEIALSVDIPIIVYNIPSRSGVNILPETIKRLSEIKNIVGIKEASGSISQACEIISKSGSEFSVLSGEDVLTLPLISVGGKGAISATSNVAPGEMSEMIKSAINGDYKRAREIHYNLLPLFKALFIETNPIPVKTMLKFMGFCDGSFRLPLVEPSQSTVNLIKEVLKEMKKI